MTTYYVIVFTGTDGVEKYGRVHEPQVCTGLWNGLRVFFDKESAEKDLSWWNEKVSGWQGYYKLVEINEEELK